MKKTDKQKKQSKALQDALNAEKSIAGCVRTLHRLETEFSDIFKLTDLQRQLFTLDKKRNPVNYDGIIQLLTPKQLDNLNRVTVNRFRIVASFGTVKSGMKSEKIANEHIATYKTLYVKKVADSLEVEKYDHTYDGKFSAGQLLTIAQKFEKKYTETFTESTPNVTASLVINLFNGKLTDKAVKDSKETLKRNRQRKNTKKANKETAAESK